MINGIREWFGEDAETFLTIKTKLEYRLLQDGFQYYYGSLVSKKSIYEDHIDTLGEAFIHNLVDFKLNSKEQGYVIAPEGTFRVYDFLKRKEMLDGKGKIFYSQECMRNENEEDILNGKTFAFWQVGFEIYGYEELESVLITMDTIKNCYDANNLEGWFYRISDKRILSGNLNNIPLQEKRKIFLLIDECNENGEEFYNSFIKLGGNKEVATRVSELLSLNEDRMTLKDLERFIVSDLSSEGYEFLLCLENQLIDMYGGDKFKFVPFIPKSWDACDGFLLDVRFQDYPYAVSGGGSLLAFNSDKKVYKSGAGIGVTRLAEYLINKGLERKKVLCE